MKPERSFRIGSVHAAVFLNSVDTPDGQRERRSVQLHRRYRDGDEWKSTSSFGLAELPQAITALELALQFVADAEGTQA